MHVCSITKEIVGMQTWKVLISPLFILWVIYKFYFPSMLISILCYWHLIFLCCGFESMLWDNHAISNAVQVKSHQGVHALYIRVRSIQSKTNSVGSLICVSIHSDTIIEFGAFNPKPIRHEWNGPSVLYIVLWGSFFPMWDL